MAFLPLLLLMVAGALSAPYLENFDEKIVAQSSCNSALLRFSTTKVSVFDYFGETENGVIGSTSDKTGMKLSGTIYIKPVKSCIFSMQISKAELFVKSKNSPVFTRAAESAIFAKELQAQDLLFRVKGGEIVSILPTVSEQPHVLNIKRGVLSALQLGNTRSQTTETDINGICDVEYQQETDTIVKSKNLTKCKEHMRAELGFQSTSFQKTDLEFGLLDSKSKCRFKVNEVGKILSSECRENHLLRPFSAGYQSESGAITTTYQSLVLIETKNAPFVRQNTNDLDALQEESLLFSFEREDQKPVNSIVDRIDTIMASLVDKENPQNQAVKQGYAHEFTQLVSLLRKLDRKRMTPVWDKYFDCSKSRICQPNDDDLREVYKQYLLDALTYCGTPTCVYMVHNVVIDEVVTGERMNMFLQGIALVAKPTKAMIRDIMNIATRVPSRQAFLTLGTLMYRYCQMNPEQCIYDKTNPVTQAELFLEAKLGNGCDGQDDVDRVEELIRVLKAIGNSGRPSRVWSTLIQCAKTSLHQNVSIAALEAMRRMPCSEDRILGLHDTLNDINTDPEVRIHSFLALMKCPGKETLSKLVAQLENEPSRQLSSFMWSHLKNVMDSSDPIHKSCQKHLKEILGEKELRVPELDITKYSRSYEGSLHSDMLKSGLTTEGHVIFHPESFLPRSGLLNLTAHVMGVPLNVLEMAIRVEGLETILADVFGPNGYMPDNGILKLFNITITKEDFEKAERSRNKRDVSSDLENNIDDLHRKVNKRRVQPSGHLSIKMFGHEMRLFSYDDIFWMIDQVDEMNVIQLLMNLAKGGHKTFTKSFLFLEMSQTTPTGLGLPLKLKLAGSAVASVELDGKFDIRNMFWGPSQMEMKGFVRPSAVAEVSGQMGIESHFINTGMMIRSNVFTSQMIKGGVTFKEGQILKVNIDAPEEPVTLFNVSTSPFLYVNEQIELIRGVSRRISPDFCLNDRFVTGLGLCTSFAVPVAFREYEAPYFPLSGPAHYSMKLVKADKKLTTYQLLIKKERIEESLSGQETIGSFEVGTPGATYSRRIGGIVKYLDGPESKILTLGTVQGGKKTNLYVKYQPRTNRVELALESNMFSNEMTSASFLFFNDTTKLNRHIGVTLAAKLGSYKPEQTVKLVMSKTSYKLHSRTTYLTGKHLTGEIEYIPASRSVNVRFDANQFDQTIDFIGKIVNTMNRKGVDFSVLHPQSGKSGSAFLGYERDDESKKLVVRGIVDDKSGLLSLGLYTTDSGYEVRMTGEAMDKTVELFTSHSNVKKGDLYSEVVFGARYNGEAAGTRFNYQRSKDGETKDICGTVFYGDKEPSSICLFIQDSPSEGTSAHKRATLEGRIMKEKLSLEIYYERETDLYALNTTLLYNGRALAQNSWQLTYKDIFNSELKMVTMIKNRQAMVRWYATPRNSDVVFGVEGILLKNRVALTATYSQNTKAGTDLYGVLLEAFVNKKLPVDYHFLLNLGDKSKGISSTLTVMKYKMRSTLMWTRPAEREYSLVASNELTRDDFVLFGLKDSGLLIWTDATKSYKQMYDITLWGKQFSFGWKTEYRQGLSKKEEKAMNEVVHEVIHDVFYGKDKKITFITSVFNGKKALEIYLGTKFMKKYHVTHSLVYRKFDRLLNVDIEFLPKMFLRFMGRLDKEQGWKLTTNLKFDWKQMKKELEWVAKYSSLKDLKEMQFRWKVFEKSFVLKGMYETEIKRLTLAATLLEKTLKIVGFYDPATGTSTLQLVTKNKEALRTWLEAVVYKNTQEAGFELRTPSKSLFRSSLFFKKDLINLELYALERELLRAEGSYSKEENAVIFDLFSLQKQAFRITAKVNPEQNTVFVHFDFLRDNMNIGFAGKYDPKMKTVSLSVEVMKRIFGIIMRADYKNYIIGADAFYQDRVMGLYAAADVAKKALIYNLTLTPSLSFQSVIEIQDDHIIKATFQRKMGQTVTNESTFSYNLQATESNLVFQWNKESLKSLSSAVKPIFNKAKQNVLELIKDAVNITKTLVELGKELSQRSIHQARFSLLKGATFLDERFDNFDFTAARDSLGELFVKLGKQSAGMTKKALLIVRDYSLIAQDRIPELVDKILESRQTISTAGKRVYKVVKNITESARPVVETAIELIKDFKLRGKTVDEIVNLVISYIQRISKDSVKKVRAMAKEHIPKILEQIKGTKIPFRDETVAEIAEMVKEKIRLTTYDYDLQKTLTKLSLQVLQMKVMDKTVEQHMKVLETKVKELPTLSKDAALKLVALTKEYIEDIKALTDETKEFLVPLANFIRNVKTSAVKHYSPLVKKLVGDVEAKVAELYYPLLKAMRSYKDAVFGFLGPLGKPYKTAFDDVVSQIRDIKILEKAVGDGIDQVTARIEFLVSKSVEVGTSSFKKTKEWYKATMKKVTAMTAEDMVEATFQAMEDAAGNTVEMTKKLMAKRTELYKQYREQIKNFVAQTRLYMKTVSHLSMEDVDGKMETVLRSASDMLVDVFGEIANIAVQLADLDLETPLGRAWKEADVMNHLEKYGINSRVAWVISKLKERNLTEMVEYGFTVARRIPEELLTAYRMAVMEIMAYTDSLEQVVRYVRSIPKKDFETFYNEVEDALLKNQETLINTFSKRYQRFLAKTSKMYYTYVQMAKDLYKEYSTPLSYWYEDIKDKSVLVYNDNKDEAVKVYQHYRGIVKQRMEAMLANIKKVLLKKYRQIYNEITLIIRKYESMTLEEIGQFVYAKTEEVYKKASERAVALTRKLEEFVSKAVAMSKKLYSDAKKKADAYYQEFEGKVMPRIKEKYEELIKRGEEIVKKAYTKAIDMYEKAYGKVEAWYENNKRTTIEEFYLRGEEYAKELYKQYSMQLVEQMKVLRIKTKDLIQNVVIPEVKKELESIFNQTLRASVVLANKTVESFAPHYRIVRDQLLRTTTFGKEYGTTVYASTRVDIEMRLKQLVRYLLELIKKVREHPMYLKYEKIISEHKITKAAIAQYKKSLVQLDERFQELVRTVKDLLQHERVLKVKKMIKEYASRPEVEQMFSTLREINESALYTFELLKPKVDAWLKDTKELLSTLPRSIKTQAIYFRQNPEECFWSNYKKLVAVGKAVLNFELREFAEEKRNDLIGLLIEVTDMRTKEAAMNAVQKAMDYYKKMRAIPKAARDQYSALRTEYETKFYESIRTLKTMWKESPVEPIVGHEVWGDIVHEVRTHELVEGFYSLVRESLEAVIAYSKDVKETLMKKKEEMQTRIETEYNKALKTMKKFVKETTLEDIVNYVKDTSKTLRKSVETRRRELEELIKKQYATAKAIFKKYQELAQVEVQKYIAKAKALMAKWKPKVMQAYDRAMVQQKIYREKFMQWIKVQKEMLRQKLVDLWKKGGFPDMYNSLIKMTIRELIDAALSLPAKATRQMETYKKEAYQKYYEYSERVKRSAEPYVTFVERKALWAANELKETAVFVNKYYRVGEKAIALKDRLVANGKEILPKLPELMKMTIKKGSKSTLRLLHSSLVYIDGIDYSTAQEYMKEYSSKVRDLVSRYIKVDPSELKITIVIPHYMPVTPSFSYQIAQFNNTVRRVANKSVETAKELIKTMKRRTEEIRRDLSASYDVNKRLLLAGIKHIEEYKEDVVEVMQDMRQDLLERSKVLSKDIYAKGQHIAEKTAKVVEEAAMDVYESKDAWEAYDKIVSYSMTLAEITRNAASKSIVEAKKVIEEFYKMMLMASNERMLELKPYISLIKAAIEDVKNGKDLVTAFRHVSAQLRKTYRKVVEYAYQRYVVFLRLFDIKNAEIRAILKEHRGTHAEIYGKYNRRAYRLYRFAKVMVDRVLRIAKKKGGKMGSKPIPDPLQSTAMIFGKLNVKTFDGKVYEAPPYNKDSCTYLLARDFHQGNFTVLSQKEKIIVITPSMQVSIDRSGEVRTLLSVNSDGRTIEKEVVGLPVQGAWGKCFRKRNFVKCIFTTGLKVSCDVQHFFCNIKMAGWHYSKTEGLLGSNNNEQYDDFRRPDGVITESVEDFVRSWEVSGDPACKLPLDKANIPACNRAPSSMCKKVFNSELSPLKKYYPTIDPKPFLRACEIESAGCSNLQPAEISHCNITAAYLAALRAKGESVDHLPECVKYKNHGEDETWTVAPKRELDVVVLMSERRAAASRSKVVASLLFNLHRVHLVGYNTRYALIGFGGKGVHEYPHIQTSKGRIFMNEYDVATLIKEMPYTGKVKNSNDAYEAIRLASTLSFRPEATRVFLLFNSDVPTSHVYGPTLDETEYALEHEADAALYVFDQVTFKNVGLKGKVFGQSPRKIYLAPDYRVTRTIMELPSGPFKSLVTNTNGGIFSNKLKSTQLKVVTTGLADAMSDTIREKSRNCKSCTLRVAYGGEGVPVCKGNPRNTC